MGLLNVTVIRSMIGKTLTSDIREISSRSGHTRFYFYTQSSRNKAYAKLMRSGQFNPVKIGRMVLGFHSL